MYSLLRLSYDLFLNFSFFFPPPLSIPSSLDTDNDFGERVVLRPEIIFEFLMAITYVFFAKLVWAV